ELRLADEAFDDACRAAEDEAADRIELEARRRAVEGWIETIYTKDGKKVGQRHVYDSRLMMLLLKGAKPEKHGDKLAVTGASGGPIEVEPARDRLAEKLVQLIERRAQAIGDPTDQK